MPLSLFSALNRKEEEPEIRKVVVRRLLYDSGSTSSCRSIEDDEQLQHAVKKLESMLPKGAISQLQSYASYGLLDVIQARASEKPADNPAPCVGEPLN